MKKITRLQAENDLRIFRIKEIDHCLADMSDEEIEVEYAQMYNEIVNIDIQVDNARDIIEERKNLID